MIVFTSILGALEWPAAARFIHPSYRLSHIIVILEAELGPEHQVGSFRAVHASHVQECDHSALL